MQKPIVVVGSINVDLVARAARIPLPGETITGHGFEIFHGGKGANQAVAAARLGWPTAMVGTVGSDAFGMQLRQGLTNAGVDTSFVNSVEGPSGVAQITTAHDGENSIVVVPGANGRLTPDSLEKAVSLLERAGFLLVQLEIPFETVEALATFAERHNIPLMLDPAPARELPESVLRRVSWITPNETEAGVVLGAELLEGERLFDLVTDRLQARGARNVLLKLGSQGCMLAEGQLSRQWVPAFPVVAVDTTAAGDATNAAFAVALLRGYSSLRAAQLAAATAAISVTRPGAQVSMPTGIEVEEFLAQRACAATETTVP